jgi:hypothetical protein
MDHIDWIGLSTFTAAMASAIVSIISVLASLRAHGRIDNVEKSVNGITQKLVEEAHHSGIMEGARSALQEELLKRQRPQT